MNKGDIETCFNCKKQETCKATNTLNEFQDDHVPCVFWHRENDTELIEHDRHIWKKASTSYSHMNGVSGLAWCQKCGAEGCSSGPASRRCRDIVVTKRYRVGGHYRREHLKNGFKIHG